MQAADVMSQAVISVAPDGAVSEIAQLMLKHGISAVCVVDSQGKLVGIVTEADLLRRIETETEPRHSHWLEFMSSDAELARDYIKARARKAADIMTAPVVTATEATPLRAIVELMERHRIKRVPVIRGDVAVGMVSRANLMQALSVTGQFPTSPKADRTIRDSLQIELKGQRWAHAAALNVIVSDGVVHLWGTVRSPEERTALRIAAENAGGKAVEDHLALIPAVATI